MNELFRKFSARISILVGSPLAFFVALLVILIWFFSGSFFGYSDTWQLFINTTTTIMTFLIVFLIQNTQNRDTKAIHLKLDELIKSDKGARDSLLNLEDLSDDQLETLHQEFERLHHRASSEITRRSSRS